MVEVPPKPKIFHITHVDNLPPIVAAGVLWSDAERIRQGPGGHGIGITDIKADRLERRPVKCHLPTMVGEYVPFNLCPRSVMLYILHKGNREGVTYKGGQTPLVHLVADLRSVVEWANGASRPWAVTDRNAASKYACFYADLDRLDRVNWDAVANRDFRDAVTKDGKQAEFLLHGSFPWSMVEKIGVHNAAIQARVQEILGEQERPEVAVETGWYY